MKDVNSKELSVLKLRRNCNFKNFNFKTTKNLPELKGIIGQNRALQALNFGVEIKSHGYHIYVLGPTGTGKKTIINKFLKKEAKNKQTPCDWLYVKNFDNSDQPIAINLPAGKGRKFKNDVAEFIEKLKIEIPQTFENEEYKKKQAEIELEYQHKSNDLFEELHKKAKEKNFKLFQTSESISFFPIINNKIITPQQQVKISKKRQQKIELDQNLLEKEMIQTTHLIEEQQKQSKKNMQNLEQSTANNIIENLLKNLRKKYASSDAILNFLSKARSSLIQNLSKFKKGNSKKDLLSKSLFSDDTNFFEDYNVNLIVDNSELKGAPVVYEKNPVTSNLIGRIEQQGHFGTLTTNFHMIKAGSLHKANGGYLIIDAFELLTKPYSWQILKRALKNKEISIENMIEALGAFVTKNLEPQSIPLNIKIILIGDTSLFYSLYNLDKEFKELFKVKSDFSTYMDYNDDTVKQYAQFISLVCNEENLKHFSTTAVAKVVEYGSRLAGHQKRLSTKFGDIVDLIRQSDYWSEKNNEKTTEAKDVKRAIDEKIFRSNRIEQEIQKMIEEGTILLDTDKSIKGQVNGIAVISLGDYSFGKPSRITAKTYAGNNGIINIDREVKLGGPIHNKGAMILSSYLGSKYAEKNPLIFSASITFEQQYEEIEGDSASSAEIYALLSSLSDYPIKQNLAVTGSVNQHGEIQPIGGINEKIEGFYNICKTKGLTGKQGVIIPEKNINNLMLQEEILTKVKEGLFHIYAISHINEGIELLTGEASTSIDSAIHKKFKNLSSNITKLSSVKRDKTKRKSNDLNIVNFLQTKDQ